MARISKFSIHREEDRNTLVEIKKRLVRAKTTSMSGLYLSFSEELNNKEIFFTENSDITENLTELLHSIAYKIGEEGIFLDLDIIDINHSLAAEETQFYIPTRSIRTAFHANLDSEQVWNDPSSLLIDQALFLSASSQWAIYHYCPQGYMLFAGNSIAWNALKSVSDDLLFPVEELLEYYKTNGYLFEKDISKDSSWLQKLMTYTYGYEEGFLRLQRAGILNG